MNTTEDMVVGAQNKQETRLSLTNCTTRLEVKVTKHCTIRYVRYRFIL